MFPPADISRWSAGGSHTHRRCAVTFSPKGQSMNEPRSSANLRALLDQVITRYGSIDAFCAQLYLLLDYPTTELPILADEPPGSGDRHQLRPAY